MGIPKAFLEELWWRTEVQGYTWKFLEDHVVLGIELVKAYN